MFVNNDKIHILKNQVNSEIHKTLISRARVGDDCKNQKDINMEQRRKIIEMGRSTNIQDPEQKMMHGSRSCLISQPTDE